MFQKILVPLDGSKRAEKILPQVARIAKCCEAEVHLLQVVVSYKVDPAEEKEERESLWKGAQEYLEGMAARLSAKDINTTFFVAHGKDAVQICDIARKKKFDLIAMASHGRSGLTRWALGSVADKVLNCSEVPVMLFRVF